MALGGFHQMAPPSSCILAPYYPMYPEISLMIFQAPTCSSSSEGSVPQWRGGAVQVLSQVVKVDVVDILPVLDVLLDELVDRFDVSGAAHHEVCESRRRILHELGKHEEMDGFSKPSLPDGGQASSGPPTGVCDTSVRGCRLQQ